MVKVAMTTARPSKVNSAVLAIVLLGFMAPPATAQPVRGGFLYTLANFTGPLTRDFSRVTVDAARSETFVLYQNNVTVFNEAGMEVYRFGDDLDLGQIVDVAVDEEGDILLLAYKESQGTIIRCNYRGEPKSQIVLRNLPSGLSDFSPNRLVSKDRKFYLASTFGLQAVTADRDGNFQKGYDLFSLLDLEEKDRGNIEVSGFGVDREGNILFTVPVLFRAYTLSPDGKVNYFGQPGGAAGRFNIAAGIVRDRRGNYLVVDKLKCAILVFDRNYKFVTQFGNRGYGRGGLIAPSEIAIDGRDRVYVLQAGRRGVSVYALTYD
jgi:hypothetical protein